MKTLIIVILILLSNLSYSQKVYTNKFKTLGKEKITFSEFYKMTEVNQPEVAKYLVPRLKRKEPNDLLLHTTVGYFAFAGILTLNHFSEECNYKGENNNNKAYIALLSGLTITYIIVISIN
ncbi:MAG: hypothetical protein HPY57_13745 [Ignavibacteria bacterium]|nr:hypothetical protein [Ignavibacteria bacterium]